MIRRLIRGLKRLLGLVPKEPLPNLEDILGFAPRDLDLYDLAFTHSSSPIVSEDGQKLHNERLEFLGDSILSAVVSHYLYDTHPEWSEGELSKKRSALVNRKVNNAVGETMGLHRLLHYDKVGGNLGHDVHGNTLEALIGAVYLDRGYQEAERFVLGKILPQLQRLEPSLVDDITNYKSILIEWCQRKHLEMEFRMLQEPKKQGGIFICATYVEGKRRGIGRGLNKKKAHQEAARDALLSLAGEDASLRGQLPF